MTQMVTRNTKMTSIGDLLRSNKTEMELALPRHLDADRMIRIALSCIDGNDKLVKCTPASLYRSVMQSSALGLELGGVLGQAYLIPYGTTATFQPGYRGLCELAIRSGRVSKIWARVVHEGDEFDYSLGSDEWIKHRPTEDINPGKIRCVYACAKVQGEESPSITVLLPREVAKRRAASKSQHTSDSPWKHWEEEMWKKTATLSLVKYLPLSPDLQEASAVGDTEEMGDKAPQVVNVSAVEVAQEALRPSPQAPPPPADPPPSKGKKPKPEPPSDAEDGPDAFDGENQQAQEGDGDASGEQGDLGWGTF